MGNFKEYYDILKENIDSYENEYENFIVFGPDIYRLLTDILNENNINPIIRLKISTAIAYFVAPYDIISEQIYGPMGYIDDIFISVYVLKNIEDDLGFGYLNSLWKGEHELKDVIDECYENSVRILGDRTTDILEYVGLDVIIEDFEI